jgi:predicted RNA-binding protein with TRAM domain
MLTDIIALILTPMSKRRKRAQKTFENVPVVDAGARGKSVAKTEEGEVIFLTEAVPGDVVNIQTYKKKKSFYEGRVTKFIELSDRRAEPVCKHFNTCGGCKWQHMTYESQLYFNSYCWFFRTIPLPQQNGIQLFGKPMVNVRRNSK